MILTEDATLNVENSVIFYRSKNIHRVDVLDDFKVAHVYD